MHNCNEVDVELESLLVVRDDIVIFPGEEMTVTVSALYNEYFLSSSHFALMYSTPDSEQMLYGTLCVVFYVIVYRNFYSFLFRSFFVLNGH